MQIFFDLSFGFETYSLFFFSDTSGTAAPPERIVEATG
jgi:hypothetical protein